MKVKVYVVVVLVVLLGAGNAFSQGFSAVSARRVADSARQATRRDRLDYRDNLKLIDWKFYKGDIRAAESRDDISMQGWEDVKVPHTWNAKDVLTKGDHYYQGIGWYRSSFDLPTEQKGKRHFIRFEGVSVTADVFVNGTYVGGHKGGYSAFCFETTSYVRFDRRNRISVRVDNSMQVDVAPSGTYLYPLFGGIYRPVTIFSTDDLCISPLDYASSGVYIKPVNVSEKQADIEVVTLLDSKKTAVIETKTSELLSPKDKDGKGLYGEYFANPDFSGQPKHARFDEQVSFDFGKGSAFEDTPADGFSIIWTGRFVPRYTGLYKFVLESDDGSKLYIGDDLIIDHWGDHAATEKWGRLRLEQGKEVSLKIEYYENGGDASIKFGWMCEREGERIEALVKTAVLDDTGKAVAQAQEKVSLTSNQQAQSVLKMHIDNPHLWNGRKDPYLYKMDVRIEDLQSNTLDRIEQPLGLRFFKVDRDKGLLLNGRPYHLHGVCRHQEWQGLGPALTDAHHKKDIELILELGANGVRLAHYQQADKMYILCDKNGLVVWAEIPNTPAYRAENPEYVQNCKEQLIELVKQNYNHPSILFWGMYNEIPISQEDVRALHQTAKKLDPYRLTTQADYAQPTARHFETDVTAWNWYFGWYYDSFGKYSGWYDNLHKKYPEVKGGLSEYGAGGCITQQQENPSRPEPRNGKFFPEQYQRLYHEQVWKNIKDRDDIWCKFVWNMFDFSWTAASRGDRPYINHKGLITHDRKVKKDSFYFYKANWSDEPVLYILSRRNTQRTKEAVEVAVYTNLDEVELCVNGKPISKKKMESDIHKIVWKDVVLRPGQNQINVVSQKGDEKYTDACEWVYVKNKD